jgi:ribosomal protein L44E
MPVHELDKIYRNRTRFFDLMKDITDTRTVSEGAFTSLATTISQTNVTPYRDQSDYFSILLIELEKVNGFNSTLQDPVLYRDCEPVIREILTKILGRKETTIGYAKATMLVNKIKNYLALRDVDKKDLKVFLKRLGFELEEDDKLRTRNSQIIEVHRLLQQNHSAERNNQHSRRDPAREGNNSSNSSGAVGFQRGSNSNPNPRKFDKNSKRQNNKVECTGCGRYHPDKCRLVDHPNFNKEIGVKWKDSATGKAWAKRGHPFLPKDMNKTLENTPILVNNNHGAKANESSQGGELCQTDIHHVLTLSPYRETIQFEVRVSMDKSSQSKKLYFIYTQQS